VHKLSSKTKIFLARKIIYADLAGMENHFYKKFTSYLCAIFGIGASHDLTHNISKN
jgi:hypothetical protein